MKKILFILSLVAALNICFAITKDEKENAVNENGIERAIYNFRRDFPEGQLADLYKSFYQECFGPGHLLNDTAAARRYLRYELNDTTPWDGPLIEPTGEGKNFYRVNMSTIRDNIIPEDVYFDAFINSLQRTNQPDSATWVKYWGEIDSILRANDIVFIDDASDRELIEEKLHSGNFTMHHSFRFDSIYNYHYRIISVPVFNEKLLPYLTGIK